MRYLLPAILEVGNDFCAIFPAERSDARQTLVVYMMDSSVIGGGKVLQTKEIKADVELQLLIREALRW